MVHLPYTALLNSDNDNASFQDLYAVLCAKINYLKSEESYKNFISLRNFLTDFEKRPLISSSLYREFFLTDSTYGCPVKKTVYFFRIFFMKKFYPRDFLIVNYKNKNSKNFRQF